MGELYGRPQVDSANGSAAAPDEPSAALRLSGMARPVLSSATTNPHIQGGTSMSVNSSTITRTDPADGADPISEAGQQAGQSAGHLAERAADIGFRQADRGKEQAAEGITQVADSIRRVSVDMEGSQPQVAEVAQTAADQAERIATYLQETDAREILRTVEDVARRQPLLFLGGAFLLGMAATRLVKAAGGSSQQPAYPNRGDWRNTASYGVTGAYSDRGYASLGTARPTGTSGSNAVDGLPEEVI
jgi:hypothetical protein